MGKQRLGSLWQGYVSFSGKHCIQDKHQAVWYILKSDCTFMFIKVQCPQIISQEDQRVLRQQFLLMPRYIVKWSLQCLS